MFGVSCPTAALCVAVAGGGKIVTSTNPTGGAAAWRQVAIGGGNIWGVSCALPSLCVGGNELGAVVSLHRPAGSGAWTFANVVPFAGSEEFEGVGNHMFGVSCPTMSFCAVAGNQGQIYTSADPFAQPPTPVKKGGGKNKNKRHPKRLKVEFARLPPPLVAITGKTYRADLRFYAKHRKEVQVRGSSIRVRAIGWTGLKGPVEASHFRVCRSTPEKQCHGFPARAGNRVVPYSPNR